MSFLRWEKLKQGLTETSGDVDLLGFEEGDSLTERRKKLESELGNISRRTRVISKFLSTETDGESLPENVKQDSIDTLLRCMAILGNCAQDCRCLREKKMYAREKFKEKSGPNWRRGQYV